MVSRMLEGPYWTLVLIFSRWNVNGYWLMKVIGYLIAIIFIC